MAPAVRWPKFLKASKAALRAAGAVLFCDHRRSLFSLWSQPFFDSAVRLSRFLIDGHH